MTGFNPYFALAGAIALVAAAGGGYVHGTRYATAKAASGQLSALTKALADRDAKQHRIDELERGNAARENDRQVTVREVYREIPKIVRDPVYRNVCITDAGVRALDRARAAANGEHPGSAAGEAGASASGGQDGGPGNGRGQD